MDYIYNDKPRYNSIDSMWARKDANLTTMYMKDDMIRGYEKDISAFTTQYFTIEALGDGEVGFMRIYQNEIDYNAVSDASTFFMYSKNEGEWTSPSTKTFSVPVIKGDKVRFKRNSVQLFALNAALGGSGNNGWNQNLIKVSTTCEYKVYGNIMSLFWGDNFAGKTWPNRQVTEDNWNWGLFRGMFSETTKGISVTIVYNDKMPNVLEGDPLPIESSADGVGHVDHYLIDASGLYIPLKTRSHVSGADYNYNRNGEYAPSYTFAYMFYNCQKLEHGPIIEDPDCIGYYDFYAMFRQCYSLKDAVYKFDCHFWKPSNSNGNPAFSQMFMYCLSLEKGPTMIRSWYWLDARKQSSTSYKFGSLFLGTYDHMFNNCQMLKYAPAIYAGTIQNDISSATWNMATITKTNGFYDYWGTFPQCFSLKEIAVFYVDYYNYNENYERIAIRYYNTNGSTASGTTSKEVYKDYPAVEATYPVRIQQAVSSEPAMNIGECTLHTNVTLTCSNSLPFTQTCRSFNDIRKD